MSLLLLIRRSVLLAGWGGLLALGLGGCSSGPRYSYRYKLTLDVEANGRTYSGANVVQVDVAAPTGSFKLPNSTVSTRVTGEANVVDLGGRLLIGLLTILNQDGRTGWYDADPSPVLQRLYGSPPLGLDEAGASSGLAALEKQRGAREIAPEDLPTLVTFRDPAVPTTVEQVDPNNLAATFGPGARLRRATIEITDEPVTRGIAKVLPWVDHLPGNLRGETSRSSNELDAKLTRLSFKREGI